MSADTTIARAQSDASRPPAVHRGVCRVFFAYDIGFSIDLDRADRLLAGEAFRGQIRQKRGAPHYFEFKPAPLRISRTVERVSVAGFTTRDQAELVFYDFGAVSVVYEIPLDGDLRQLVPLSDELWDNAALLKASRAIVDGLVQHLAPAIRKPHISGLVEDYVIFQLYTGDAVDPHAFADSCSDDLARILRAETSELSQQEIDDALQCRISFGPRDVAIIDWNASVLFDPEPDDVLAVLEYANVELLEMRYLDDRLDDALEEAYDLMSKDQSVWQKLRGNLSSDVRRVAELQIEAAFMFEGVNNALKLLGDQYLARLYALVSQRMHLVEWDSSVMRKLDTLESIYQKIQHEQSAWRMEVLEWIIIALIAISIALPFIPGVPY